MPVPVCAFHADQGITTVAVDAHILFINDSTGNITAWDWAFGDGETKHYDAPSDGHTRHAWTAPGQYTIRLEVDGPDGGARETKTNYITVTA